MPRARSIPEDGVGGVEGGRVFRYLWIGAGPPRFVVAMPPAKVAKKKKVTVENGHVERTMVSMVVGLLEANLLFEDDFVLKAITNAS